MQPYLEVKNIGKEFPGVHALDDVSIAFYPGKAHVLLGENGAGKSTLIKVISGIYQADSGDVYLNGEKTKFENPRDALAAGIAVIHQELSVIPDLTVAENIFLGREPMKPSGITIDRAKMARDARELIESLNVKLNPRAIVRNLNAADRQVVEILRAVSQQARVVIMDEPTSSLSDREVEVLYSIIKQLKDNAVVIIYISHKLDEIFTIGDEVSVLRDGRLIATRPINELDQAGAVALMVGREIGDYFLKSEKPATREPVLEVKNLSREGAFENASFTLYRGEVLGVSGLIGAGRTELMRAIFGADQPDAGEVILEGKPVSFSHPSKAIAAGLGLVPEDRRNQGVIVSKNVKLNVSLASLPQHSRYNHIDFRWERDVAIDYIQKLRIKTPSEVSVVKELSGGNQQKVVLAKWMAANARILIMDEPTRGIDVNAKQEIYTLISKFTAAGGSVILVSSELPEVLGVCHRIAVMREGKIMTILEDADSSEQLVMSYATGQKQH
ncbi:MAG: sugar ABC transporter ATP-binding protein [Planctomycetes bacterium]|nr:sugar ABC transporter ATP-binding protein [Planctomycetota bacterium]